MLSNISTVAHLNTLFHKDAFKTFLKSKSTLELFFNELLEFLIQHKQLDLFVRYYENLFKECVENRKLTSKNIELFLSNIDRNAFLILCINNDFMKLLFENSYESTNEQFAFKNFFEFVDVLKNQNALAFFLINFLDFSENSILNRSKEELRYLFDHISRFDEFYALSVHTQLFDYLYERDVFDRDDIRRLLKISRAEICQNKSDFNNSSELLREFCIDNLISNKLIDSSDIYDVLSDFDRLKEIQEVFSSTRLKVLNYILDKHLLDSKLIEKLDEIIDKSYTYSQTLFDYIIDSNQIETTYAVQHKAKKHKELYESFKNKTEFDILLELMRSSSEAESKLNMLIDNDLLSTFEDFEELTNYLKKKDKKRSLIF